MSGTGPGIRRYSTSSNALNLEEEHVFSSQGSRLSVVNGSLQGAKAQAASGLSLVAMAEVQESPDNSNNSNGTSGSNVKKFLVRSRSKDTSPYRSMTNMQLSTLSLNRVPSMKGKLTLVFNELMSKFGLNNPSHPAFGHNKSFEKICLGLARVDGAEVALHVDSEAAFETTSLELVIKTLNNQKFLLMLPPPSSETLSAGRAGDDEEQGAGGTCEQFIGMLPDSCKMISEKASPLGLVPKLLPYGIISKEARYVGSCFWMWLCIVDDLTENLLGKAWDETEADLFLAFSKNPEGGKFNNKNDEAVKVSLALRNVIHSTNICSGIVDSTLEAPWRLAFMDAVCEVLTGFREERPLLSDRKIPMYEWMKLRAITISVRPFLILARADMGLSPTVSKMGNPLGEDYDVLLKQNDLENMSALRKTECMLQVIMGLQNDILGWEKDFKTKNQLSAIQVLIQHGAKLPNAMTRVIGIHNELVRRCLCHAQLVWDDPSEFAIHYDWDGLPSNTGAKNSVRPKVFNRLRQNSDWEHQKTGKKKIQNYVGLVLGFANGMANWMAVSKRYIA